MPRCISAVILKPFLLVALFGSVTPAAAGSAQTTEVPKHGVQAADIGAQHAAAVEVGAEHAALLGAGHGVGLDAEPRAQRVGLAGEGLVLGGIGSAGEAARQLEVAVDRLGPHDGGDLLDGLLMALVGQPGALLETHRRQRLERARQRLRHVAEARRPLRFGRLLLLDHLDDAADADEAVEPRRLGRHLALQLADERHELIQERAIDAHARRLAAARQRQADRDVAALEPLRRGGAGDGFQRLEADRQPTAHIEIATVDALHLPGPVQARMHIGGIGALAARETGHAGNGHGVSKPPNNHEI